MKGANQLHSTSTSRNRDSSGGKCLITGNSEQFSKQLFVFGKKICLIHEAATIVTVIIPSRKVYLLSFSVLSKSSEQLVKKVLKHIYQSLSI